MPFAARSHGIFLATLGITISSLMSAVPAMAQARAVADPAGVSANVIAFSAAEPDEREPGPVPELTTENSTVVRNQDGTYTAEISSGPVNYQDQSGEWEPISNELVDAPGTTYAVQNEANDYTVSIPENPAVTPVRFETGGDWVTMKLASSDDVEPDVSGTEAVFDDLTPAADEVTYEATDTGVKETIQIDGAPTSSVSYSYNLTVSAGITPVLTDQGVVEFRDEKGETKFLIPRGSMSDSRQPDSAFSDAVGYRLQKTSAGWRFTITPSLEWLVDPGRVYPVSIDPTVDKQVQKDCFLQQEAPGTTHCGEQIMKVGATNNFDRRRALFDFNINGIPADAVVSNATAWIFMDQNSTVGAGGATEYALFNPSQMWGACASWTYTCSGGGTWVGGGSQGQISTNTQSLGGTTSGWQSWNITDKVGAWVRGTGSGTENRGVMLRQTGAENVRKVLGFVSSTHPYTGLRPLLRVTFGYPPATPTGVKLTPCQSPCYPEWVLSNSTTPVITTNPNPDMWNETYTFQVARLYDDAVIVSSPPVAAPPGVIPSWQVPGGYLNPDEMYEFRVVADNGDATSATAWAGLQVRSAPATAQVSSLTLSPCAADCASLVTTSTTPDFAAQIDNPSNADAQVVFSVRTPPVKGHGQQVVATSSARTLGLAQRQVTYTPPAAALVDGASYQLTATVTSDGKDVASKTVNFNVNLTDVNAPDQITVSPCLAPCSGLVTGTTTPTFTARNADDLPSSLEFELQTGTGAVSGSTGQVPAGGAGSWTVPASAVSNGVAQLRIGAKQGAVTSWSSWREVNLAAPTNSQPAFATSEAASIGPGATPDEIAEASRPYAPDPALDADDTGPAFTPTQAQIDAFTGPYVQPGQEAQATAANLVKNYAPVLLFDSEEDYGPLSARTFLNHSKLEYAVGAPELCAGSMLMSNSPRWDWMANGSYSHLSATKTCTSPPAETLPRWHSNDQNVRPRNDGGPDGRQGMFLDLENEYQDGQAGNDPPIGGDEPTYFRFVPRRYIGYYFLYGHSAIANPIEQHWAHEGDWEMIWVIINSQNVAKAALYEIHGNTCVMPWGLAPKFHDPNSTHLSINVGNHSHASYPSGMSPRRDDDASGDGVAWYTAGKVNDLLQEDWFGYSGGWGQVGGNTLTTGPEGIDAFKGQPERTSDYCMPAGGGGGGGGSH